MSKDVETEPDTGGACGIVARRPLSSATTTAPELAVAMRPLSVSRFSRCRSARISEMRAGIGGSDLSREL